MLRDQSRILQVTTVLRFIRYKKARREVQGGRPEVNDFMEDYHRFLVDYVLCGNSHRFSLRFPSSTPKNIDFCACPKQRNGIDCGLFAGVAVVLRIIDGIPVTVDTCSQEIITALRNNLTYNLVNVKSFRKYTLPSGIVRGIFDALPVRNDVDPHSSSDPDIQGSDPDDDDDVEVVNVVQTKADTLAAYRVRYKSKDDAAAAIASKTRSAVIDDDLEVVKVVKTKADTLAAYRARYKAKDDAAAVIASKTRSAVIASKTRSAAAVQQHDDSSTDSDDRKMPAVIIKSKKTRSATIKSKKARSAAIASKTRSAVIASKTRSAAAVQQHDDSSTDSDDRKMPAVIIKSKKTRSATIKSKKTRSAAIASKTRSAAAAQHIDDSSTDSEKPNSQEAAAASQMDDALVAFIARRIATKRAAIRANVPVTVDSKKGTQAVNEVTIPTSSLSDDPNVPATIESKKSTLTVNKVTASPKIGTPVKVAESASSSLFDTIVQTLTPASLKKSSGKKAVSEEQ